MYRYRLLLLLLLSTASCSRKDCVNGQVFVHFENFTATDFTLIEITAYERGSSFTKVDRVFYAGTSVKNFSADSVGIPVAIDLLHDYQVRFTSNGQVYRVHELFFLQQNIREQWGKKPMDCVNELAYTINSTKLKRPMKTMKAGGAPGVYLFLDKNENY